jgi:hypothetical protein
MKRSATTVIPMLLLTAAVTALSASATASPPAPADASQTLAAGEACPFPIEVAFEGKGGNIDLPHNPHFSGIATSPDLRVTVTNLSDPSKTVTVNATGAFRFVADPEGGLTIVAGGHNFLYGVPEVGATALATTGPIEVQVVDNNIASMDLSGAKVRDLCAELA